jgi:hypothetical protein
MMMFLGQRAHSLTITDAAHVKSETTNAPDTVAINIAENILPQEACRFFAWIRARRGDA